MSAETPYARQIVLPNVDLGQPWGVAVDAWDNVYVADYDNRRVLQLVAGP
ncbi:hypothetical protein [Mycobacterium talmoniae]|uniref:Serine/threonine-protein kinase PknD n=1 Tax=Mycobacterium talmoniae TaxID=1858794 RepID=A0A2S8BSH9_9MYCO|nr:MULTISPECIES: hypothetical protein [Mycobacterium]PQM49604.1 Serine/threonine-protein kinase PknD [Mycobacterium talmoniae]